MQLVEVVAPELLALPPEVITSESGAAACAAASGCAGAAGRACLEYVMTGRHQVIVRRHNRQQGRGPWQKQASLDWHQLHRRSKTPLPEEDPSPVQGNGPYSQQDRDCDGIPGGREDV